MQRPRKSNQRRDGHIRENVPRTRPLCGRPFFFVCVGMTIVPVTQMSSMGLTIADPRTADGTTQWPYLVSREFTGRAGGGAG